jgi:ABC-type branched-subunit amino acid transport system ATPase component
VMENGSVKFSGSAQELMGSDSLRRSYLGM